jgi:hypothetical protein
MIEANMKKDLNTFLNDDMVTILKKIGEYEFIMNYEKKCEICEEIITIDNIFSISKKDGKYIYTCNNPSCVERR